MLGVNIMTEPWVHERGEIPSAEKLFASHELCSTESLVEYFVIIITIIIGTNIKTIWHQTSLCGAILIKSCR
jgi:hypothetical protein